MEWHSIDADNLALIDREIGVDAEQFFGSHRAVSPAKYEIIRRIIYATGDFEYQSLIGLSEGALAFGAAALAARSTIVVDVPMVQVGITPNIQNTFANPVYCSMDALTRPQKEKNRVAWGIETLAKRYPEAIFVIGQDSTALTALIELIEAEEIRPALVIATPAGFVDADVVKQRLHDSLVPHIRIIGSKGSAVVAVAIVDALVDLAGIAYGQDGNGAS